MGTATILFKKSGSWGTNYNYQYGIGAPYDMMARVTVTDGKITSLSIRKNKEWATWKPYNYAPVTDKNVISGSPEGWVHVKWTGPATVTQDGNGRTDGNGGRRRLAV